MTKKYAGRSVRDVLAEFEQFYFSAQFKKLNFTLLEPLEYVLFAYPRVAKEKLLALSLVIDFQKKVMNAPKLVDRQWVEKKILESFIFLLRHNHEYESLPVLSAKTKLPQVDAETHEQALLLLDFCHYCLAFKRPRDNFSSKRKGLIFRTLARLAGMYEIPGLVELLLKEMKLAKGAYLQEVLDCLLHYLFDHAVEDDFLQDLDERVLNLVARAKTRSMAFSYLSFLVELGRLGEFSAMSYLDDWKDARADKARGYN